MLKKTRIFAGDRAPFVMELPAYRIPTVGSVLRSLVKDHRSGKPVLCGEDCPVCGPGGCPFADQLKEIYDEYLKELDAKEREKLSQFEVPSEMAADVTVDVTADINIESGAAN